MAVSPDGCRRTLVVLRSVLVRRRALDYGSSGNAVGCRRNSFRWADHLVCLVLLCMHRYAPCRPIRGLAMNGDAEGKPDALFRISANKTRGALFSREVRR